MNKLRKRRVKNNLQKNKFKFMIIVFIFFIMLLSTGYAVYHLSLTVSGTATIASNTCDFDISSNLEITNRWTQGDMDYYDLKITIINNQAEPIVDWVVDMNGPSDLAVSWMSDNYTIDSGHLRITPAEYNSTIATTYSIYLNVYTVEDELDLESVYFNDCLIYGTSGNQNDPLTRLEISPDSTTISIGEIKNLTILKTPSYKNINVTWSSSDDSIVTVSNDGTITGVSAGTAVITASAEGIVATSTIEVEENVITLESISISPSSYRMGIGDIIPLQVTKNPQDVAVSITWTSSNPDVAIVDENGSVTALTLGTTTITASAEGKTATCNITVRDAYTSSDVLVSHEVLGGGYYGGDTLQFKVTVENLTDEDISYFKITYDLPDDVQWNNWQPQAMIFSSNYHELIYDSSGHNVLKAHETYEFSGLMTLPEKYLEDGVNQWGGSIKMIPEQYLEMNVVSIDLE